MAPQRNNEQQPGQTGTIPKTKVRNNCNVPQEAVTPTRRDMSSNIVSTSLDWVPVSEYNQRSNFNQSRKQTNNLSDQELADYENSASYEGGFGRFVPVRPQPRALPLNIQNRDNLSTHNEEVSSLSGYSMHSYPHSVQNGLTAHSNHAAAAVMIVNPTTPNAVAGMPLQVNSASSSRINLTRNFNQSRNHFEGSHSTSANTTPPIVNSRAAKTVNLMNNMYEGQSVSTSNLNEAGHTPRESARALGDALVSSCPDASAVERRLSQIREYIRVTSSLVDTMRNSEDEDVVLRPLSVQSNTSVFSENDMWQNDVKNVMDYSQQRLPSGNQQQRRQHKHQEDAHLIEEMNRARSLDMQPSTSHDNFSSQHYRQHHQSNQIGIATTLPHSEQMSEAQSNSVFANEHEHHRYMQNEAAGGSSTAGRNSDEDDDTLNDRRRELTHKLRELQMKKQHMENLVSEFQKIQMASGVDSIHNTYSSTGEESGDEEPIRKGGNQSAYNKNEDPFKLMEIKAIKAALEKTKDLMRRVENCEENMSNAHDDSFQLTNHSNLHDNKSEGGASTSGWSNDGSVCRVRNPLSQRHKFTNERLTHNQNHEANIASLQDLAQELRMETEKIMGERARLKDIVSNKAESSRKQKKTNEPPRSPGPAERRQLELRALLAQKQKELEALLNKEKVLSSEVEAQKVNLAASVANQSYSSEIEESRSDMHQESQNSREENIRVSSDRILSTRMNAMSSHLGSVYASDSDSTSRVKSNQRNRGRRRTVIERQIDDSNTPQSNVSANARLDSLEPTNVSLVPPLVQENGNMPYGNIPLGNIPPSWNNLKSNQDMRANQFTQNSHSQTMDRLLSTPQMSYPPTMPFNMMMPYGMAGACGCGCSVWATWCCQQMALQQREIIQLRDQLAHLEERWRTDNASHTLNNQVPPGNRANNYWDNFRSYSRQNLLSANSKANMEAHLSMGANASHIPHPLVDRSHNALRPRQSGNTMAKRNVDASRQEAHSQQRSLSLCSAPEELNGRSVEDDAHNNRRRRDVNIAQAIPEGNAHAHNINSTPDNNHNNKSRSKLTTKTSGLRPCAPNESMTAQIAHPTNVDSADSYEGNAPPRDALRIVDLLKENIYSEVSNLIGVNESHPDYLLQLFKELQQVSSDALRQNVLHSIRSVLARGNTTAHDNHAGGTNASLDESSEGVSATNGSNTTADITLGHENTSRNANSSISNTCARFLIIKSEEIITPEFANSLISHVTGENRNCLSKRRLKDVISKYEGSRVSDVFDELVENISRLTEENYDSDTQQSVEMSDSPMMQDVAGSLNLFSSSDSQLHQINVCPYELWPEHVHMDASTSDHSRSQEGKSDLINCSEMLNGDLAEADQTLDVTSQVDDRPSHSDALPDVVDANESTPTEAEAEWLGLDRIPTRLHTDEPSEKQKD